LAQLQGDQNYRNVRLTGTHLFMQESFRYERREVIEWLDEDVGYRWQEAGEIAPREPTVAEVEAWLASQRVESPPPAGPWKAQPSNATQPWRVWAPQRKVLSDLSREEALAVRDALNALGASKGTT
jgi:hypothetical protein